MTNARFTGQTNEVGMRVAGLSELKHKLEIFPEKVQLAIERKALKKGLQHLLAAIKAAVPYDAGRTKDGLHLRDTLKVRTRSRKSRISRTTGQEKKGYVSGEVVAGGNEGWYAHLVEYGFVHTGHYDKSYIFKKRVKNSNTRKGTSHVAARPFMRPATEREFERILDIFEEALAEAIEETFGRV